MLSDTFDNNKLITIKNENNNVYLSTLSSIIISLKP